MGPCKKLLKRSWEMWNLSSETLVLVLVVLGTLTLLEITLLSSLVTAVALLVIINFAQILLQKAGYHGAGVGVRFAVGVGAFTFSIQFLILVGVPAMLTHWSIIGAMVAFLIFDLFKSEKFSAQSERASQNNTFMAISVALLVATLRHVWILPFAAVVIFFGLSIQGKKIRAAQVSSSVALLAIGWLISSSLRPDRWWYFYADSDFQFFESLSWSIARWGIFEHPGLVGGSIAEYHWLTYGYFGGLTELASLEPWTALLKIGPILFYFVLAELIINASPRAVNPKLPWRWIVLVFVVWLTRVNVTDSWAFSILIAVAFLRLSEREVKHIKPSFIILWLLFSTTLIFSKITTSIIVVVILLLKIVWDRSVINTSQIIPLVSLVSVGTITAGTFRGSNGASSFQLPQLPTNQTLKDFSLSLIQYGMSVFGTRGLLPHFVVWGTVLVLLLVCAIKSNGTTEVALAVLTPISLFATLFFKHAELYFFLTPHLLLSIYCANRLLDSELFDNAKSLQTQKVKTIFALIVGLLLGSIWRHNNLGYLAAETSQSRNMFLLIATFLLSIVIVGMVKKTYRLSLLNVGYAFFILSAGALFSFQVDDFFKAKARGVEWYSTRENTESIFGTKDLLAVGEYVRQTTKPETILASNNFYPNLLHGGANYLLPAETRRRFLIQGLRFQTVFKEPSVEQVKRMNLSLEFAERPSPLTLRRLKEYGVEGYVVNLALTDHRDWSEFATEVFRSGNFVFLILK